MKRDFSNVINKIEAMKDKLIGTINNDISKLDDSQHMILGLAQMTYNANSRKDVYDELILRGDMIQVPLAHLNPPINSIVIKYVVNNTSLLVLNEYTDLFILDDINMDNLYSIFDTIDSLNNMLLHIDDKKKDIAKVRSAKRIYTKLLTLICYAMSPLVLDKYNVLTDRDFKMSYNIKYNHIDVYSEDNRNLLSVVNHIKFDTNYLLFHNIVNGIPTIPVDLQRLLDEINKAERHHEFNLFEDIYDTVKKSITDTGVPRELLGESYMQISTNIYKFLDCLNNTESSRKDEVKDKFKISVKERINKMKEFSKEFNDISKNINDTINDGIISILKKSKFKTLHLNSLKITLQDNIRRIDDELSILKDPDKE